MRLNDIYTSLKETINIRDESSVKYPKIIGAENKIRSSESIISSRADINLETKKRKLKKIYFSGKSPLLKKIQGKISGLNRKRQFGKYDFAIKLAFALFFIAVFLWIDKILVTAYVESGYKRLLKVQEDSGNVVEMQQNLNDARFDFILADLLYYPFRLIPSRNIWNGHHIIKGGKSLSELGDDMFGIYSGIQKLADDKGMKNIDTLALLANLKPELLKTNIKLDKAIYHYDKIKNLDDEYVGYKLSQANDALKNVQLFNSSINTHYPELLRLLGSQGQRKYLVVFQNADEIRPTGGFMGSMGIATLDDGRMTSFDKRDVYNYEWNLKTEDYERIEAPKGIDQLTSYLGLRDANYLINLKDSSENIQFFMEKAGFEIDGIIYLNQNVVLDLLEKTGGVKLDYLEREITHHNFSTLVSTLVEAKITKLGTLGTPKQILFDFIEQYQKDIEANNYYPDVANVLIDNLMRREIGIYSFREDENILLSDLTLNYNIDYSNTLDFAYPVYTSISGNKSDRYMKREYSKDISIGEDCSINTNLEITLKHLMTKNKQQDVSNILNTYNIPNKNYNLQIQGTGPNHSFMRVLLPKDALVQDNNLISIIEHPSSTEVNFFIKTRLLETRGFNLYYSLPNPECKPYDFKLYKQPGIRGYNISISDEINNTQKSGVNTDFYYSIKQ